MATIRDVKSANFQMSLAGVGQIVADVDDIRQCIAVILSTPKGSDAMRPLFGSNLYKYADVPISQAAADISREATIQVNRWEPRVRVVSVEVGINSADKEKRQVLVNISVELLYSSQQVELLYSIDSLYKKTAITDGLDDNAWMLDTGTPFAADGIYYLLFM